MGLVGDAASRQDLHSIHGEWPGKLKDSLTGVKAVAVNLNDNVIVETDATLLTERRLQRITDRLEKCYRELSWAHNRAFDRRDGDVDKRMLIGPASSCAEVCDVV